MMHDNSHIINEISLSGIGKKFNSRWIFRNVNLSLKTGDRIAINGSNGSGKSTLLKIISGYLSPYEGKINWSSASGMIPSEQVAQQISYAAPYLDLIEPFTLKENIDFFCRLKPLLPNVTAEDMMVISGLSHAAATPVQNLSSGMKQRLKLTMAFLAGGSILFLDEPLSNLDEKGYQWYGDMAEKYLGDRIVLVCSNHVKPETGFCNRTFNIEETR